MQVYLLSKHQFALKSHNYSLEQSQDSDTVLKIGHNKLHMFTKVDKKITISDQLNTTKIDDAAILK